MVISPGSPLPGINASLRLTIVLIMAAAGMVLVIACGNAAGLQLARATVRQQELGMRLSLGASRSRLIRQLVTESALLGALAGALALPVTWAMMHLAVTKAAEELPADFTLILDVSPDITVFTYVLAISVLAGVGFGLAPAMASSRSALFSITRGTGASLVRSRLRHGLIAAQVAVSLTLMIAGGLLVRSASLALSMGHGIRRRARYRSERSISRGARLRRSQGDARARHSQPSHGIAWRDGADHQRAAPDDEGGRRAAVSLNGEHPSAHNTRATLYYTWVQPNYFETLGIPLSGGQGFRAQAGQPDHTVILSESARPAALARDRIRSATACVSGPTGNSTTKANCFPTARRGRSSAWPATPEASRWTAATLNRSTCRYRRTGSRITRFSCGPTSIRRW